ncbi:MAG: hypothetical protein AAFY71_21955 [Bacteroidota bacterium]
MKKLVLVSLMIALFAVACEEIGLSAITFDYDYTFDIEIPAPLEAGQPIVYEPEMVENTLIEELEARDINFVENIVVNSVSFTIPEEVSVDFTYLQSLSAALKLDDQEINLKFVEDISTLAQQGGKRMVVEVDENTPDLAKMVESEMIGVKYTLQLNETIEETFEVKVELNTTVTTNPFD